MRLTRDNLVRWLQSALRANEHDWTCEADRDRESAKLQAIFDLALQSLSLESVRSEALVEPSPEQWQEFYDRVWDSDETNPTLALPMKELQRIARALIAALQSPARVAEQKDVDSTELRK